MLLSISQLNLFVYGIYSTEKLFTDQFPAEYSIPKGNSRTGNLVFLVSRAAHGFALQYYDFSNSYITGFAEEGEVAL